MPEGTNGAAAATPDAFGAAMSAWSAPQPAATPPVAPATPGVAPTPQPSAADQLVGQLPPATETPPAVPPTDVQQVLQQPPDALAEQIHGMPAKDVLEALKRGELPTELAGQLKHKVMIDGEEALLPIDEIAGGYQRLSDYRRKTQALSGERQQLEQVKGKVRAIFSDFDKPEGFAQVLDNHGLGDNARAYVTRNWGTAEQPNVQGFLTEMHRLGHWRTFQAAANAYAQQYGTLLERFAGGEANLANPQIYAQAEAMVRSYEAEQAATMAERVKYERGQEQLRRQQAAEQRKALLAQRQPQQQAPALSPQDQQRATAARERAFTRYGIAPNEAAGLTPQAIEVAWRENVAAVAQQLAGSGATLEYVIERAAFELRTDLRERGLLGGAAPAPVQQQAAAPAALPARPQAAPAQVGPAASGPSNRTGGTPDDFGKWTSALGSGR